MTTAPFLDCPTGLLLARAAESFDALVGNDGIASQNVREIFLVLDYETLALSKRCPRSLVEALRCWNAVTGAARVEANDVICWTNNTREEGTKTKNSLCAWGTRATLQASLAVIHAKINEERTGFIKMEPRQRVEATFI